VVRAYRHYLGFRYEWGVKYDWTTCRDDRHRDIDGNDRTRNFSGLLTRRSDRLPASR
jgi:hypothetical protein